MASTSFLYALSLFMPSHRNTDTAGGAVWVSHSLWTWYPRVILMEELQFYHQPSFRLMRFWWSDIWTVIRRLCYELLHNVAELSVSLDRYGYESQPWCGHLFSLRSLNMASGLFQEFQCHSRRFPSASPWVCAAFKNKRKDASELVCLPVVSHSPKFPVQPYNSENDSSSWETLSDSWGGTPPPAHEQGSTPEPWVCCTGEASLHLF